MAKKRSEWMRGLLECEQYVQASNIACAEFVMHVELVHDQTEYQNGWYDALNHYKRLAGLETERWQCARL
jgi:hypothetical protein